MKLVLGQIRDVAFQCRFVLAQRVANQDPARMRPPLAVARRVRITFLVRELVMLAMRRHPQQRPPSKAATPQIVRKYSNHLGVAKERWVSSR